eukprot:TRINITY_DN3613_c0_g1_i6.p1 TRINITY_DN3613_c0_g1~~TRINITY_DN3613_c0_g1_i6.p1  ORF type:complete len:272 (+),score=21.67 TRINITY_DN3613_c0_g1_i6:73-888(+)
MCIRDSLVGMLCQCMIKRKYELLLNFNCVQTNIIPAMEDPNRSSRNLIGKLITVLCNKISELYHKTNHSIDSHQLRTEAEENWRAELKQILHDLELHKHSNRLYTHCSQPVHNLLSDLEQSNDFNTLNPHEKLWRANIGHSKRSFQGVYELPIQTIKQFPTTTKRRRNVNPLSSDSAYGSHSFYTTIFHHPFKRQKSNKETKVRLGKIQRNPEMGVSEYKNSFAGSGREDLFSVTKPSSVCDCRREQSSDVEGVRECDRVKQDQGTHQAMH